VLFYVLGKLGLHLCFMSFKSGKKSAFIIDMTDSLQGKVCTRNKKKGTLPLLYYCMQRKQMRGKNRGRNAGKGTCAFAVRRSTNACRRPLRRVVIRRPSCSSSSRGGRSRCRCRGGACTGTSPRARSASRGTPRGSPAGAAAYSWLLSAA
jgi:hypothetical protein